MPLSVSVFAADFVVRVVDQESYKFVDTNNHVEYGEWSNVGEPVCTAQIDNSTYYYDKEFTQTFQNT